MEIIFRTETFQAEFLNLRCFTILISNEIPFSKFHIRGGLWINKSTWLDVTNFWLQIWAKCFGGGGQMLQLMILFFPSTSYLT